MTLPCFIKTEHEKGTHMPALSSLGCETGQDYDEQIYAGVWETGMWDRLILPYCKRQIWRGEVGEEPTEVGSLFATQSHGNVWVMAAAKS